MPGQLTVILAQKGGARPQVQRKGFGSSTRNQHPIYLVNTPFRRQKRPKRQKKAPFCLIPLTFVTYQKHLGKFLLQYVALTSEF